jgi:hypothetical protein
MAEDELKLRRQAERATRAKMLVEDPLLNEAFAAFENDLTKAWLESKSGDTAGRERIWALIRATHQVKEFLGQVMKDGRVADRILEQMTGTKKSA